MILILLGTMLSLALVYQQSVKLHMLREQKWIISWLLSASTISLLYWISLQSNLEFKLIITAVLFVNSTILYLKAKPTRGVLSIPTSISRWTLLMCLVLIAGSLNFTRKTMAWGQWDGWAIWNLRAKYLFHQNEWSRMLSEDLMWTHPDYPMMLPGLIASLWYILGHISPVIPAIIALLTFLSILLSILSDRKTVTEKSCGGLAATILICDSGFVSRAASQYADSMIALYYLLIIIILHNNRNRNLSVVGLLGGLTMWIKNEGIVFFMLLTVYVTYTNRKKLYPFFLGAIPGLLVVLHYKIYYAPHNDLINTTIISTLCTLDYSRLLDIIDHSTTLIIHEFKFITVSILTLLVVNRKSILSMKLLLLVTVLLVYLSTYLITPYDLHWHLNTSCDRLFHHIQPAAMYLIAHGYVTLLSGKVPQ